MEKPRIILGTTGILLGGRKKPKIELGSVAGEIAESVQNLPLQQKNEALKRIAKFGKERGYVVEPDQDRIAAEVAAEFARKAEGSKK